jgi:hypothetical protein
MIRGKNMKKSLIIVGMVFLLIFVCLSGCNDPGIDIDDDEWPEFEPLNHIQIGDSVKVNGINYTFENAYTAVRIYDDYKYFTIVINCTNEGDFLGCFDETGSVQVIIYKMEDGTKCDVSRNAESIAYVSLSPGESKRSHIYLSEDWCDIDFSKIAEVYLTIAGCVDRVLDIK